MTDNIMPRFSVEVAFDAGVFLRVSPPHGNACDCGSPTCGRPIVHFYDPSHRGHERTMLWPCPDDALALAQALLPDGWQVLPVSMDGTPAKPAAWGVEYPDAPGLTVFHFLDAAFEDATVENGTVVPLYRHPAVAEGGCDD